MHWLRWIHGGHLGSDDARLRWRVVLFIGLLITTLLLGPFNFDLGPLRKRSRDWTISLNLSLGTLWFKAAVGKYASGGSMWGPDLGMGYHSFPTLRILNLPYMSFSYGSE